MPVTAFLDLAERVADGDFCGDLGNRITGGLRGQRRRARDAGVDLDDHVFEAFRIERVLDVAATLDAEGVDDIQRTPSAASDILYPRVLPPGR